MIVYIYIYIITIYLHTLHLSRHSFKKTHVSYCAIQIVVPSGAHLGEERQCGCTTFAAAASLLRILAGANMQ